MTDERGVSITVTHVMTIGVTTILIAGLFLGAGNMLQDQTDRTGDREMQAIGDRHATEIVTAAVHGTETEGHYTVRSRQPQSAVGGGYIVNLSDTSDCFERSYYDGCLILESSGSDISAEVPIGVPEGVDVQSNTVQGGDVVVHYYHTNTTVTIRGDDT